MESLLSSIFLEELVLEGDAGSYVDTIFEKVTERGYVLDSFVRKSLWKTVRAYPHVLFLVSSGKTQDSVHTLEERDIPLEWKEKSERESQCIFNFLKLVAKEALAHKVLDVWNRPEILQSDIRMKILYAVAGRRYKGIPQIELCQLFQQDTKWLFQHLKAFYKYNMIVRRYASLPQSSNKTRSSNTTYVIWLERFFNKSFFSKEMLQALELQQQLPMGTQILDFLSSLPNNIALESDIRSFFFKMSYHDESSNPSCNSRLLHRQYNKLRRDLLESKQIIAVQAFCKEKDGYEDCLALSTVYDKFCSSQQNIIHPNGLPTNDNSSYTQSNTLHVEPHEDEGNSICKITTDILPSLSCVSTVMSACHETSCTTNGLKKTELSHEPLEDDDDSRLFSSCLVYELPMYEQILCLLKSSPVKGVLTTDIAEVVGVIPKRLMRLLSNLENSQLIVRHGERLGKHFIYRFFLKCCSEGSKPYPNNFSPMLKDATSAKFSVTDSPKQDDVVRDEVQTEKRASRSQVPFHQKLYTPKTLTIQFRKRLQCVKETVENMKVCTIPNLIRVLAVKEGNNGPDRKTVIRLLNHAMFEDKNIQQTQLPMNSSDLIKIYYYETLIQKEEAEQQILHAITEKRLESSKNALRKNALTKSSIKCSEMSDHVDMDVNIPTSNQHQKKLKCSRPLLPMIYVSPHTTRTTKFSQAVLGNYGFIFSLMIRLKIFHSHLITMLSDRKCNNGNNSLQKEAKPYRPAHYTTLQILRKMTIETFFRTIGCGYVHPYLDDIFQNKLDITVHHCIEHLPPAVYKILLSSSYRGWRPAQKFQNSSSGAVISADRLLQKLVTLKCVNLIVNDIPTQHDTEDHLAKDNSPTKILWQINPVVSMEPFVSKERGWRTKAPSDVSVFHLIHIEEFDAFWKHFKSHVDQWLQFLQNPEYCTTNASRDSLHTPMNDVFHLSGRTSLVKASTSQASPQLVTPTAIQMPASVLPDNMPLSVAFTKRNWTAKLLLSPSTRAELEKFALSLLQEVSTPENEEFSNEGTMSESSLCCYSLKSNHNWLSIQTPSIREVASRLSLCPDVVIRYLSRFFNPKRDIGFTKLPFSIYTGREPRYSCDSCTNVYFQKRSLVQHCLSAHRKTLEDGDGFNEKQSNTWKSTSTSSNSNVLDEPRLPCDPLSAIIKQENSISEEIASEWMEAQKLVENLRREHVVLFFCYVIIAEQLYRSSSDARIRTHTNGVSSWVNLPQEIPPMDHVLWELTSELFTLSSPFYRQAKRCRKVFLLLLKKYPVFYTRVLRDYNQHWSESFSNTSVQRSLPVLPSTVALSDRDNGNMEKDVNFWKQTQSVIDSENIMRMVLICPLLCYRPSWAIDICNSISVEQMVTMTHTWSKHNWIVKAKSTLDRWTNVQRLMDFQCRRKYYISHAVQQLLFEKKKDYMLLYDTINALKNVNETLSGNVVDPCQSCMLYCLLEGVAEGCVQLQVEWESEPELYDWDDQTTDDKLLQLLTNNTFLDKDDVGIENNTGTDAETELIHLLLTENQEPSITEFHEIEKMTTHTEPDICLTENANESDFSENELSGLDVKQQVAAKAVEGGLEKHITELTRNVKNIFDEKVTFTVTCPSACLNEKHLDTLETTTIEQLAESLHNKHPQKKRTLKLFLPCSEFLRQLGCFHETDYPDPLLFSNLGLAYYIHHCQEHTNENPSCTSSLDSLCSASVQIVPWYDSDIDLKWQWGDEKLTNTEESVSFFKKPKKHTPAHSQFEQFIHRFFIEKNSSLLTSWQSKKTLLHHFTKYLLTENLSRLCPDIMRPSSVYQLCSYIKKNFPNYPNVNFHLLAESKAYTSIFYYLQELCLNPHETIEEYFSRTEKCKETLPEIVIPSEYVVPLLIGILQYVDDSKETGVTENNIISFVSTFDYQRLLLTYQTNFICPNTQFIQYLIRGLELLRWITRFPHDKDYIFLTTRNINHSYILKKRVCGVQVLKYHSEQHTLSRCTYSIPSLPFGGLDDIIFQVIPQNIWQLWGPLSQCHWDTLVTCAFEGNLENLLLVLTEHQLEILLCRTLFISLIISTTETHLFHPLPTNITPFGSWIQLDGYLNATLIAFLVCHIYMLLKSTPGALQEEVIAKTPLLAKCETIYLLDNLCIEQFIYKTQDKLKINCLQYFNSSASSSWLL